MDKLKRIKAGLLLLITMMSLSGCSKDDIKGYIENKYKIVISNDIEDELGDYCLLKVNELDVLGNKHYNVIGRFDTLEEARAYLDLLITNGEDKLLDDIILSGASIIIVGGFMFYSIKKQKEYEKDKEKVLKK